MNRSKSINKESACRTRRAGTASRHAICDRRDCRLRGAFAAAPATAQAAKPAAKKPNILVIWGDDIGYWNISAYNQGMMGYKTPNIDRIAKEGALFTDWYGQQSCTAGRARFITGQVGFRTGMLKVGLPGARKACRRATSRSPSCSRRRAT